MKINLTRREIEYILFLISESNESGMEDGAITSEYSEEDLQLMEKLETALRALDNEKFGIKNEPLN